MVQVNRLTNIRKIAVLRANGLGDYLFAVPALHAIKAAYPSAELVYLGCPWHKAFLENRPGPVDRVIVVPISNGVRTENGKKESPDQLAEFFERIRAEKFDLAVQIHGGGRNSNPFLLKLGARITAGLRTPDAPELDISVPYVFYQNEVMRYLEVAQAIGGIITRIEPSVRVTADDHAAINHVLKPSADVPLIVVHPGATDPRRRWLPEKFAEVGNHFADQGITVVVTGTGDEKPVVNAVADAMRQKPINLCDRLSWPALVGLFARADLVISNDSGPLHLAAAVGTPTVGLFWCGNMINGAPITRTRHRPAISWMVRCPRCHMDIAGPGFPFQPGPPLPDATGQETPCPHPYSFVDEIQPGEVIAHACELLQTRLVAHETLRQD